MPPKNFKVGDVVRFKDSKDIAYNYNNLYRITHNNTSHYILYSFQTKKEVSSEVLEVIRDEGQYANVKIMMNCTYRLATKAEIALYITEDLD